MVKRDSSHRIEYLKNWRETKGKQYHKEWYLNNKRSRVLYNRFRKFGITHDEFVSLLNKQEGRCRICTTPLSFDLENQKNTHIDHCHKTNQIRGILCRSCNVLLGCAQDNIQVLEKAILYLKESQ